MDIPEKTGKKKSSVHQDVKNNTEATDQVTSEMDSRRFNGMTWEEVWAMISIRTGIMEPEVFFQRIKNRTVLLEQINTIQVRFVI
jgi:hypothetical protein